MNETLPADTGMGAVTLRVANLDVMTAFYRDAVGLTTIAELSNSVSLGRTTGAVVILEHAPELVHASPSDAGLFHTAILFDTEEALAAAVYSVTQRHPNSFTGSADHLVSKAFYFTDPEGNGLELYWDRDRSAWSWTDGSVAMSTLYLDPSPFLQEHLSESALSGPVIGDAKVGHVHLQVGDVEAAREFYVNTLGFRTTVELPRSALFVSAGGYHHHMAMNVWNSRGAGRRKNTLGLGRIEIGVGEADDLGALVERMNHHRVQLRDDGKTVGFNDPWANQLRVTVEPKG